MRYALALVLSLFLCACADGAQHPLSEGDGEDPGVLEQASPCDECLDIGGTWQPQIDECTLDCDLLDLACYMSSCPGVCEPDACHNCFDEDSCLDAACSWSQEEEASWCDSE